MGPEAPSTPEGVLVVPGIAQSSEEIQTASYNGPNMVHTCLQSEERSKISKEYE